MIAAPLVGLEKEMGESVKSSPIGSMYGVFTYIWRKFMVNVGKYTIHGSYGSYARYFNL